MTGDLTESLELGPIRPPSEAFSLLLRVTRNCPWNRCRFCHIYKGEKFQLRSVAEIKEDIKTARDIQEKIKEMAGCGSSPLGYVRTPLAAPAATWRSGCAPAARAPSCRTPIP